MMARKHLHELLQEDQEPFLLKNYIADRRCQLKKSPPKTHLQLHKPKPISQNSNFPLNFCKKACLFSLHDSPDLNKSPLFQPITPNTKNTNGTAFGLFGSILKRLTHRTKNPKPETATKGSKVSVKDILRWDSTVRKNNVMSEDKCGSSSYTGRPTSDVWSQSNEEMDMDTSCSSSPSGDFEEVFISNEVVGNNSAFASFDKHFSQSPLRFVLQTSPSFSATSPSLHERKQEKENYELESLKRFQVKEEEEEQCSPVSVLDRPFEDNDRHADDDDGDSGIDRFDLESTYAFVQRAKQQLLQKLSRFEKLAELDPIELEKRMLEEEQDDQDDSSSSQSEMNIDGMKKLVSDLIAEEEMMQRDGCIDKQAAAERVRKRLDSWKDVESNTIDMMVEQDFKRAHMEGWKGNEEEVREAGIEVECAIFGLLMQELIEELVL
ncbi:hypothetical protein Goklo_026675 [Gossypium klotzschianum]|uniref:DUF4378 domain-containing protein n=1 Tax=Gossypium klotzschianum TaxID=34286 RepID=A0A7J8TVN5_9ROSI|nr:hypothetical protein [Gossypium klotzschianum]